MKPILTTLAVLAATPALAANHLTFSDLDVRCNQHGAEIILGPNTGEAGTRLFLGKNCDAYRPDRGTGHWSNGAAGFVVEINGEGWGYITELDCPALPFCSPP